MNRFDIIQGKTPPPPKKEEESILPGSIRGIDIGDGDSRSALVLMQGAQIIMAVQPDQSLQIGDSIGVDGSGRAVLTTDESVSIGVVLDPTREAQIEQNEDSVVVGRTSQGQTIRGYLHEHPRLQQELGVDEDHIIVDRRDWERARLTLAGRNDSATETIDTNFSLEGGEEEIDPSPEEISVHPFDTDLDDDWSEWVDDGLPF